AVATRAGASERPSTTRLRNLCRFLNVISIPPAHRTERPGAFFLRRCALSYEAVSEAEWVTDARLVARCREGSDEAWSELVERFSRYVYAICVQGFRLQPSDAEDVFQEVFARPYQHLDR